MQRFRAQSLAVRAPRRHSELRQNFERFLQAPLLVLGHDATSLYVVNFCFFIALYTPSFIHVQPAFFRRRVGQSRSGSDQ